VQKLNLDAVDTDLYRLFKHPHACITVEGLHDLLLKKSVPRSETFVSLLLIYLDLRIILLEETFMKKFCILIAWMAPAVTIAACGPATINPNYSSANPDLMRIGGEAPADKGPEIINMGSYCLSVTEKWKADGKTPDGQTLWTKDTLNKAIPCR